MKSKTPLRLLVCFVAVAATIGAIAMAITQKNPEVFYQGLGGTVGGLFLSYWLGVWDD